MITYVKGSLMSGHFDSIRIDTEKERDIERLLEKVNLKDITERLESISEKHSETIKICAEFIHRHSYISSLKKELSAKQQIIDDCKAHLKRYDDILEAIAAIECRELSNDEIVDKMLLHGIIRH